MTPIIARNVSMALPLGVDYLLSIGVREQSRAGEVLVAPTPVITCYERPTERVLFNKVRDANPFFHLMESMWMLAGRNDAEFLNQYVHDFGLRYAEDGIISGAYGYRWRHYWDYDQIDTIVKRLKYDPQDRRIVLGMWDPQNDLGDIEAEAHLQRDGRKDIPCNTHVYFRIRGLQESLDMTVCCRSNDIIWGAYGANAVHFSFLQEYIASKLGVRVGRYYQFSNNFHAYVSEIEKLKIRDPRGDLFIGLQDHRYGKNMKLVPLIADDDFDLELSELLRMRGVYPLRNRFLRDVVRPVMMAHWAYKNSMPYEDHINEIAADDWRVACKEWIERRLASRETRAEADKSLATTLGQE